MSQERKGLGKKNEIANLYCVISRTKQILRIPTIPCENIYLRVFFLFLWRTYMQRYLYRNARNEAETMRSRTYIH